MSFRYRSDAMTTNILKAKHHGQFYKAHLFKAIFDLISFHSMEGDVNGKGPGFQHITNFDIST